MLGQERMCAMRQILSFDNMLQRGRGGDMRCGGLGSTGPEECAETRAATLDPEQQRSSARQRSQMRLSCEYKIMIV